MKDAGTLYFTGAVAVGISKISSTLAGFISLFFLTRILSKEDFGGYAFSISVVFICAIIALWGLERAILLRVSRINPSPGKLRGTGLVLRVGMVTSLFSVALVIGLWLGAETFVKLGALPQAIFWLPALGIVILPMTVSTVMQVWFQANHRVVHAVILPGIVDMARAICFAVVFFADGGKVGIVSAVFVSSCVPIAVLAFLSRGQRQRAPRRLMWSDMSKGSLFVFQRISSQGMSQFDLILLGMYASGVATAEYAVAARLAALCSIGGDALGPTFSPRGRRHLTTGAMDTVQREYHIARVASFLFAVSAAAGLAAIGPSLLSIFGTYEGSYDAMLLLMAGFVVVAGTGMHANYLAMSGEVVVSTLLRISALVLFVFVAILLIVDFGSIGAAVALLLALAVLNFSSLAYLWWRSGFLGTSPGAMAGMFAVVAILSSGAFHILAPWVVVAGLTTVVAATLLLDIYARSVASEFRRQVVSRWPMSNRRQ